VLIYKNSPVQESHVAKDEKSDIGRHSNGGVLNAEARVDDNGDSFLKGSSAVQTP
jgi:hypothetical protein